MHFFRWERNTLQKPERKPSSIGGIAVLNFGVFIKNKRQLSPWQALLQFTMVHEAMLQNTEHVIVFTTRHITDANAILSRTPRHPQTCPTISRCTFLVCTLACLLRLSCHQLGGSPTHTPNGCYHFGRLRQDTVLSRLRHARAEISVAGLACRPQCRGRVVSFPSVLGYRWVLQLCFPCFSIPGARELQGAGCRVGGLPPCLGRRGSHTDTTTTHTHARSHPPTPHTHTKPTTHANKHPRTYNRTA